jgi:hypothetical protein
VLDLDASNRLFADGSAEQVVYGIPGGDPHPLGQHEEFLGVDTVQDQHGCVPIGGDASGVSCPG